MPSETQAALELTLTSRPTQGLREREIAMHLLVIEPGTSSRFRLPAAGEVEVGRAAEAGLSLSDQAASRRHARLWIGEGVVRI